MKLVEAAVLFLLASVWGSTAKSEVFRIGVRTDAPPFSHRIPTRQSVDDGGRRELNKAGYGGYVVRICDEVIAEFKERYPDHPEFRAVPVNARDRFSRLDGSGHDSIDVLCDPATVTSDRAERYLASLPIYLSGISFASHPIDDRPSEDCAHIIGVVGQTTADAYGVHQILRSGELGGYANRIRGYLQDPETVEPRLFRDTKSCRHHSKTAVEENMEIPDGLPSEIPNVKPEYWLIPPVPGDLRDGSEISGVSPVKIYDNHTELAAAFCSEEVLYYVGDIEIVNRKLKSQPSNSCEYADAALTYNDERYVIFARIPGAAEGNHAIQIMRFLKLLSELVLDRNSSVLIGAYYATFPGFTPTRQLQTLMWSLSGDFPR